MSSTLSSSLDDILHKCIHCGLCLPVCPTYQIHLAEESSPRGRIRLMRNVYDGIVNISDGFVDEMYFCLDCQACETACPAGVQYGDLVEDARALIHQQHRDPLGVKLIKSIVLRGIIASKRRLKIVASLLRFYQKIGVMGFIHRTGILKFFSLRLHEKHNFLPIVSEKYFDQTVPEVILAQGGKRGRVAFLTGCLMNVMFADVHRDAVEVLSANGFEVVIPQLQECCGSLAGHHGDYELAKHLAQRNISIFERYNFDALVIDSAGCAAFMKEYGKLLADDAVYSVKAEILSRKTKEITEFLVEVGYEPCEGSRQNAGRQVKHSKGLRVTYHEACHLVHTQKISSQPRELLKTIPGLEVVELPEATWCCGSAGIYNVIRYDDSMRLLERKMNNIASTKADIIVTANPGCHYQLECGVKKYGLNMSVMHPVSLLALAYRGEA